VRRPVATEQPVTRGEPEHQSLDGRSAGGMLPGVIDAVRRNIADRFLKDPPKEAPATPQQETKPGELPSSSQPQVGSDLRNRGLQSLASQLTEQLKHSYGINLQYVRHHKPVDATTREGHFLKAGSKEFFWDSQKGQLLSWNSGARKWETMLPKIDEESGQRFLASTSVREAVDGAISEQVNRPRGSNRIGLAATLNAADETGEELKTYGSDMRVLNPKDRAELLRNESVVDAIAKICQMDESEWTDGQRSFMKSKGINSDDFLKLYKMMCEARESDAIARQKYAGSPDSEGLVSFHRLHMVAHILDNSFTRSVGHQVTRLRSAENPDALGNYLGIKRLAV
jgi:hypothetical protein